MEELQTPPDEARSKFCRRWWHRKRTRRHQKKRQTKISNGAYIEWEVVDSLPFFPRRESLMRKFDEEAADRHNPCEDKTAQRGREHIPVPSKKIHPPDTETTTPIQDRVK